MKVSYGPVLTYENGIEVIVRSEHEGIPDAEMARLAQLGNRAALALGFMPQKYSELGKFGIWWEDGSQVSDGAKDEVEDMFIALMGGHDKLE